MRKLALYSVAVGALATIGIMRWSESIDAKSDRRILGCTVCATGIDRISVEPSRSAVIQLEEVVVIGEIRRRPAPKRVALAALPAETPSEGEAQAVSINTEK